MLPAILGLSGDSLGDDERAFFREAAPAGFILFGRNCRSREQLRRLTDALREVSGRDDVPILVDQEGGKVARLGPPEWPDFPAPARFADLFRKAPISAIEAARANGEAIALTLADAGINVDCLPLLDLRHDGAHAVIGERALGGEPMQVAALGRALLDGLEAGGVGGVVKHMPGHGRAAADSHVELPVVDADEAALAADLAPFRALRDAAMGMVGHVLYSAWDAERCASQSPLVIGDVVRGRIGFEGLLMTDDLGMHALSGALGERGRASIAAGCDVVLHGSGILKENEQIAAALDPIGEAARQRLARAMARIAGKSSAHGYDALAAKRDALLAYA
jgi:beta-N-acetylhexosaminidase